MTETPEWQPTFDEVARIPGRTAQQPQQKTWEDRLRDVAWNRKRAKSDIAVALGAFDTGDDFDPDAYLGGVGESITANTAAIVTLQDVAAAMNTTAAYVGDQDQMVSVARDSLKVSTISGSATVPKSRNILDSVEFVGSGHFHHVTLPVVRPAVEVGDTNGDIIYTPITSNRSGLVEGMAWVGGADTSIFSIDHYYVALCVYNPTTGNIEKAWDSGDIKDAEASVSNPDELYIAIDTEQICSPGQMLFAAHQQIAPGGLQTARTIGVSPQANISRNSAPVFDAWCFRAPLYSNGIPSSISLASLTRENRYCPWFGLRVSAIEPGP